MLIAFKITANMRQSRIKCITSEIKNHIFQRIAGIIFRSMYNAYFTDKFTRYNKIMTQRDKNKTYHLNLRQISNRL